MKSALLVLLAGIILASCGKQEPKPDFSAIVGTYSLTSETGDSCERLEISDSKGVLKVGYAAWYCGEGDEMPALTPVLNAKVENGTLTGTTPDGNKFMVFLKDYEKWGRKN